MSKIIQTDQNNTSNNNQKKTAWIITVFGIESSFRKKEVFGGIFALQCFFEKIRIFRGNSSMECRLCLETQGNLLNIASYEAAKLNVAAILYKYFRFCFDVRKSKDLLKLDQSHDRECQAYNTPNFFKLNYC